MSKKKKVTVINLEAIKIAAAKNVNSINTTKNLAKLNTNRGNLKGFIGEHMVAEEINNSFIIKGQFNKTAYVIDNNGLYDIVRKTNGKVVGKDQVKFGYETTAPKNLQRYNGKSSKIVINGDANNLEKACIKQGVKYEKSGVTVKSADKLGKAMKVEGKITRSSKAPITSTIRGAGKVMKNCHKAGKIGAKTGALGGAGFSMATNTIDVIKGDKDLGEATVDVAVDTAISAGIGYGATVIGTAASTALSGTAAGTAISTAGATIASTAAGTAITTGVTAVSATIAGGVTAVLGTGAIATATAAAAPIVIGGAAIGVVAKGISSLFRR